MNNTRARTQRGLRGLPKTLHATWGSASAGGLDLFADRQAVPFKRLLEDVSAASGSTTQFSKASTRFSDTAARFPELTAAAHPWLAPLLWAAAAAYVVAFVAAALRPAAGRVPQKRDSRLTRHLTIA